jgi:hypothetical protein
MESTIFREIVMDLEKKDSLFCSDGEFSKKT